MAADATAGIDGNPGRFWGVPKMVRLCHNFAVTDFSLPLREATRDLGLVDPVPLVALVIGEAMVGQFELPD